MFSLTIIRDRRINELYLFITVHPCDSAEKGGCEHVCNKDGDQSVCSCNDGYKLKEDQHSCVKSKSTLMCGKFDHL